MTKTKAGPVAGERLKSFIERIERLREEKKAIGSDERDVFSEAKGVGFDPATMRWLLKEREVEVSDRDARDDLRDTYALALSMAVNLVRVEGLPQREAAKLTGTSKSSVNRALAVPEVSQPAPVDEPAQTAGGVGHNSKRACILPTSTTWQEITAARTAHEARIAAEREAKRERRRQEHEAEMAASRRADEDDLAFPPGLDRRQRVSA